MCSDACDRVLRTAPSVARSQAYPAKPITLIVPFAPGAVTDLMARVAAELIRTQSGQSVVVENRPGASGNIGTRSVARAAPDGYTLGFVTSNLLISNPSFFADMGFDPIHELVSVGSVGEFPQLLVTSSRVPATTLREFIDLAKAKPGQLSYGSAGRGSASHLAVHTFASLAGIKLIHVPYRGMAPALIDLLAGRLQIIGAGLAVVKDHLATGNLRCSRRRQPRPPSATARRSDRRASRGCRIQINRLVGHRRPERYAQGNCRSVERISCLSFVQCRGAQAIARRLCQPAGHDARATGGHDRERKIALGQNKVHRTRSQLIRAFRLLRWFVRENSAKSSAAIARPSCYIDRPHGARHEPARENRNRRPNRHLGRGMAGPNRSRRRVPAVRALWLGRPHLQSLLDAGAGRAEQIPDEAARVAVDRGHRLQSSQGRHERRPR